MDKLNFEISDGGLARIIAAFCAHFNFDKTKAGIETQENFCRRMIADYIKNLTFEYESHLAEEIVRKQVLSEIDLNIKIV